MCLNIGTPKKNINFPFETNGKLMVLGVPILKHYWVTLGNICDFFFCKNNNLNMFLEFISARKSFTIKMNGYAVTACEGNNSVVCSFPPFPKGDTFRVSLTGKYFLVERLFIQGYKSEQSMYIELL